jgi:poly-beta-1,6-N-acetyl-D-glucosamine N-deacetylase
MKFIKLKKYKSFILGFCLTLVVVVATNWLILNLTAPRIPILGFHSIIDGQQNNASVSEQQLQMDYTKQDLEQFLDYLVRNNFWFLSAQELYNYFIAKTAALPTERIGQRPIMISFDDSYKTYYTQLLPILENLEKTYTKKVKVVLFVNPGYLAKDEKSSTHLVCGDLREGLRKGFYDLQSHGQNHKDLTKLNPQDLVYELAEAQTQLRKCTEGLELSPTVATHLAYPFGAVNKQVEAYVSKYYLSGYLYNTRMFKLGWLRSAYQIPRLSVNREKPPSQLIEMAERALKVTQKN